MSPTSDTLAWVKPLPSAVPASRREGAPTITCEAQGRPQSHACKARRLASAWCSDPPQASAGDTGQCTPRSTRHALAQTRAGELISRSRARGPTMATGVTAEARAHTHLHKTAGKVDALDHVVVNLSQPQACTLPVGVSTARVAEGLLSNFTQHSQQISAMHAAWHTHLRCRPA